METRFTEGKWDVGTSKDMTTGVVSHTINKGDFTMEQGIHNAFLIAESPVMYKMIEDLTKELSFAIMESNLWRNRLINITTEDQPDLLDGQTCREAQLLLAQVRGEV
tara:strand:+ start:3471 stop:3791 length:321 start_codon:yes stop_codon:yes gene_type:complete